MIITVAFGTSMPTSITLVATSTSASPSANIFIAEAFSADASCPWISCTLKSLNSPAASFSASTVAARAWRQAALDAAEALSAEPGMARGRVALWGYSRGAAVGVDAATSPGSGVRSAVLVAGGGSVDEDLAGRDLSVLMLHARRDEAVPVRSTLRLAGELREAGAAVEVRELAFDNHRYDLPTWCAAFSATRTFLEARDGPA